MPDDDKILYGAPSIAAELGCTPRQCYDLLAARKVPGFKLDGAWCSTRAVLRSFAATMAKAGTNV